MRVEKMRQREKEQFVEMVIELPFSGKNVQRLILQVYKKHFPVSDDNQQ